MSNNTLVPEYLDINYNTLIQAIKDELADSIVFKDYDYEGSNISVLMELVSYIGELNTFFLNKIARNIFIETVDVYENANRLARQEGYEPKGYISSKTTLTVTVSADSENSYDSAFNNTMYIPAWHTIYSTKVYGGSEIPFATTNSQTFTASGNSVSVSVHVIQGEPVTLSFTGKDIVDNELLLPTYNYAHDDDLDDETIYRTFEVIVNGVAWSRINDFYDEIGVLTNVDDVYMVIYDKYERTKLLFSSSRNVPANNDEITVKALKSIGNYGNVAASTITMPIDNFIKNLTDDTLGPNEDGWIDNSTISVTNSAASIGGNFPEDVDDLRIQAQAVHNTQYRNVTATDYESNLESRSNVEKAHAWGEQEIAPSGSILEYNKVHLSVIPPNDPSSWETGTINTSSSTWTPSGGTVSGNIIVPLSYVSSYTSALEVYLEPRKMLNAYEYWELPELIYFSFTFGIRLKRLYTLADVSADLKNKIIYYFRSSNMDFYDIIDFKDIYEYLLDTTITSPSDEFTYIKGIRNLIIRDIDCNVRIYETNSDGNYPQYTTSTYASDVENTLRPIRLGHNQFPVLLSDTITVDQET